MDIRVEQGCPQCGASIVLDETDQLLTCSFCGVKNFLQSSGPFRYVLPVKKEADQPLLLAPYLRFKGTIFLVTSEGISHRVVDTTQSGTPIAALPASLGVRPQAMRLQRIDAVAGSRYLPQQLKASAILEKAVAVSSLATKVGQGLYHRAYIGESLSYIYLPMMEQQGALFDAVTDLQLAGREMLAPASLQTISYDPSWQVRFLATLCPHCGATLDGEGDCRVMTCANCHSAWALAKNGLERLEYRLVPGNSETELYLPFWKISGHIPALGIYSFADFVQRTNQPFLPKLEWQERIMSLWIPAVKLRPKIFLQAGRQATLGQWQLKPVEDKLPKELYPATLAATEAKQAAKIILAAATTSPRLVYPYLPKVQLTDVLIQLIYLPFIDKGHDWVQPETGVVIGKNILEFGRSM